MIVACFRHHLDGIDNIPATKTVKFNSPVDSILGFELDLCDKCYEQWKKYQAKHPKDVKILSEEEKT